MSVQASITPRKRFMKASLFVFVVVGSLMLVSACADTVSINSPEPPPSQPSHAMAKEVLWFSCASWDHGYTFTCVYTGTEVYQEDYWLPDRGELMTTTDCTEAHSLYCDQTLRDGPNHTGYSTVLSNETQTDMAPLREVPPDCTRPQNAYDRAYCGGAPLAGDRLTRVNQALAAMDSLGGVCSDLAAIGRRLVANNAIRVYDYRAFPGFGGGATRNGSTYRPDVNEWLVLSNPWVDYYYDWNHATNPAHDEFGPRSLQFALAHELDHLKGEPHIDEAENKHLTENTLACAGAP